ncbi:MAG: multiheme c-type cytochrome, partial [Candidatus Brocadiales bacterium]
PMLNLLDSYQERLRQEGLLSRVEKFPLPEDTSYVGSRACSPCHPAVFQHWGRTLHATAYETLLKAGRALDPECVACHVVGLNYVSGFQSQEASPDLTSVGCEACHGPGSLHIAECGIQNAECGILTPHSEIRTPHLGRYGKVSPEACKGCHDPEHGPPFQFDPYWERIRHPVETPVRPGGSRK